MNINSLYYNFDNQETILYKLTNALKKLEMKLFIEKYDNSYYQVNIKKEIYDLINFINQKEKEFNLCLLDNYKHSFEIKHFYNCYDICQEYLYIILNLINDTFNSKNQDANEYIILLKKINILYQYILNNLFKSEYNIQYSKFTEVIFMDIKLNTSLSEFNFNDININNMNTMHTVDINHIKKILNDGIYKLYNNISLNKNCFMSYLSNVYESSCDEINLSEQIIYVLTDTINQLNCNISEISSIIN